MTNSRPKLLRPCNSKPRISLLCARHTTIVLRQFIDASGTLCPWEVGSLLYAAIATWPDIVFAILRLSKSNTQPKMRHHAAANCVCHYLAWTQDLYIWNKEIHVLFFWSTLATHHLRRTHSIRKALRATSYLSADQSDWGPQKTPKS